MLDGTWKANFESYATFRVIQPNGKSKHFANASDRTPLVVTLRELITDTPTFIPSITGSFAGTLYAEDNRNDSLVIDRGTFAFLKPTSNFNQCHQ